VGRGDPRSIFDEVLELAGGDRGLAQVEHLPAVVDAVRPFARRL
jgi:hypothetical protein